MNILIVALGSGGDVDPAVGLGRRLRQRSHDVTVITHAPYERTVTGAGLQFAAVDTPESYAETLQTPGLVDRKRALELLSGSVHRYLAPVYDRVVERLQNGNTVVLAESSAFGARIAQDRFGFPLASLHISPYAFYHGTADQVRFFDTLFGDFVNGFRARLGLAPVEGIVGDWYHSKELVLGFFPRWFAPDLALPPHTRLIGFPMFDERDVATVPPDLEAFIDAGDPPILFTFGTAMRDCHPLFEASVGACERLGRRGMLLTRDASVVPSPLPPTVRHFPFIPFSEVMPRVAAVVHHGGIGTAAQAMAAGAPTLVVPFAFDQPQNAAFLTRLGVARTVLPGEYTAERVAAELEVLLTSADVKAACADLARRFDDADSLAAAADAVEELAGVRR